jgi:hypothetical protein
MKTFVGAATVDGKCKWLKPLPPPSLEKNCPIVAKAVAAPKKPKIYIEAKFESPKHLLHQTTFEI